MHASHSSLELLSKYTVLFAYIFVADVPWTKNMMSPVDPHFFLYRHHTVHGKSKNSAIKQVLFVIFMFMDLMELSSSFFSSFSQVVNQKNNLSLDPMARAKTVRREF